MSTTFKIQESHIKTIHDICDSFNNDPGELINVLHKCQGEFGYLPEDVQREIASKMKISVAKVYGVVSFYSFFTMIPKGRHAISVCMGTACYVRGAEKVVDEFKSQLSIKVGGVTEDGKFSLDCLRCVGACGLAPVVLIGEKVYGRVEPHQVKDILAEYND
jgi:NADH-quinone oxidoreductase subunit E/NADP-reducing hydrogenase subunit HndA